MGVGQVWSRALVYFGIVEEDEYWDDEAYAAEEELERTYDRSESANVRRLSPRRQRREEFEDWSEPDASLPNTAVIRQGSGRRPLEAVASVVQLIEDDDPALRKQMQAVSAATKDSIQLNLTKGRTVVWGSRADSSHKLTVLKALLRIKADRYDVSAPDQPTTTG